MKNRLFGRSLAFLKRWHWFSIDISIDNWVIIHLRSSKVIKVVTIGDISLNDRSVKIVIHCNIRWYKRKVCVVSKVVVLLCSVMCCVVWAVGPQECVRQLAIDSLVCWRRWRCVLSGRHSFVHFVQSLGLFEAGDLVVRREAG